MFRVLSYVRYSHASLSFNAQMLLGAIIFFLLCGILIFQIQIWDEEYYSRNKKWLKWKASAIKSNKSDLSNIYPDTKE